MKNWEQTYLAFSDFIFKKKSQVFVIRHWDEVNFKKELVGFELEKWVYCALLSFILNALRMQESQVKS